MKITDNNKARIVGQILGNFEYSHTLSGESFYLGKIRTERTSGFEDIVPIMVSERLVHVHCTWDGVYVEVEGQFRSYNKQEGDRKKLMLTVFVTNFSQLQDVCFSDNVIELDGFVCKEPCFRTTPSGREITDLLLAVNRAYGKSDYIPCISWGRNASFVANLEVGTRIRLTGRIQSREYQKKISEAVFEKRVAYEVSITTLEVVYEEED